jgi:hypothetical protein
MARLPDDASFGVEQSPRARDTVKYMLLIYEPESAYQGEAGQKTLTEVVAKHMRLAEELAVAGVEWSGSELQATPRATTVATGPSGAQTVHDGPFAETREQLGGFYLIEVADAAAALHWARKVPVVPGGKIEIRPCGDH